MAKLVIDMMGSDLGSAMSVEAVKLFHKDHPETELVLVGKKEELTGLTGFPDHRCPEVVKMATGALEVLHQKDSSMVKAIESVKELHADGVVSAGSTGAFLSASTLLLKKIEGVERPALVTSFPNFKKGGFVTILDVGASSSNTAEELRQFALMGSFTPKSSTTSRDPEVKLLSNGSEEGKGSPLGKEAYPLLQNEKKIHFGGNIEGNSVLAGEADVVV
jgi:glycerol-3-phosphate acyltransferase PlsX